MPDLAALRAAATARLQAVNEPDVPLTWRRIDLDGSPAIALTCNAEGINDEHAVIEETGERDTLGVYDCCPDPWIEVGYAEVADYLLALLNAHQA